MPRAIFCLLFFGITFHTKKSTTQSLFATEIAKAPPHPKSKMSSPVLTITEGKNINNHTKTKIRVGSVVKAKVGELEKITREGISRRTGKYMVECVHSVVEKNKFIVQLEDRHKKEKSFSSFVFLILREDFDMDEAISHSNEKEQGKLLTIVGDPEV